MVCRSGEVAKELPEEGQVRSLPLCDACVLIGDCQIGVSDLNLMPDGMVQGRFPVPDGVMGHVVAHGGWIAWVFDEVLGLLSRARGEWAVTRTLSITYVRPVPIGADVVVTSWLEGEQGATWTLRGEMRLAGAETLLASAAGEWAVLSDAEAHFDRAREWSNRVTGSCP